MSIKGSVLLGQSGGPTSVINASSSGLFLEALKHSEIENIYAAKHGIKGILNEEFYDIKQEDIKELELLKTTPSSEIGSVRYKLKNYTDNKEDYERILEVFKKWNIRYFFYNGGNDSMDTCNKISKFLKQSGYECYCIGIPKTIDNDLEMTDHTPGFASAAKYVATSLMEIYKDSTVYETKMITVVEVMGRNAGWLTASATLASYKGCGPDLIYLPEVEFSLEKLFKDTKEVLSKKNQCLIVVSEGIKQNGKYIPELYNELEKDSFGHSQLGGTALILADLLKKEFNIKVRSIEFSLLQRCSAHLASKVDVNEAYQAGKKAMQYALKGKTDYMVSFKREIKDGKYKTKYVLVKLEEVANKEKKVPLNFINKNKTGLTQEFIDYLLPLIQGEEKAPLEDGLPRFARLKKILAKK